jgi:hypothetical protein
MHSTKREFQIEVMVSVEKKPAGARSRHQIPTPEPAYLRYCPLLETNLKKKYIWRAIVAPLWWRQGAYVSHALPTRRYCTIWFISLE